MPEQDEEQQPTDEEKAERAKLSIPVKDIPVTLQLLRNMADLPTTPARYQGKPMDMFAVTLVGRELGIGPMTAINGLLLVNGQLSMFAKLMAGLIFSKGHIYHVEADEFSAVIKCQRYHPQLNQMFDVGDFQFTLEDAERAELNEEDKEAWVKYPAMMLTNRALSWAARMVYADCIQGVGYNPDEVGMVDDDPGHLEVIEDAEIVETEENDDEA